MEEQEIKEIVGAKYNSGIDKIYTMSTIRKGCHDYKLSQNYFKWYQCLRAWRSEMNAKFEEDERNKCNEYHRLMDSLFFEEQGIIDFNGTKIDLSLISNKKIDSILYDYELYLGDLAKQYNMGMPDAEDDEGL